MYTLPEMKSHETKYLHLRLFHQNKNDWFLLNESGFFLEYNYGHNILRFFDVLSNAAVTTSQQSLIISNEHGRYVLPHGLLNN